MGGLSRFFYSNQGSMARKLHKQKRRDDGFEAPRNSVELLVETKQNAPNIVARLMGMDAMPVDTRPDKEKDNKSRVKNSGRNVRISDAQLSPKSNSFRRMELDSIYGNEDRLSTDQNQRFRRAKPREHPQEEELQKFKKEFQAWQNARVRDGFSKERKEWFSSRSRSTSVDFDQCSMTDCNGKMDTAPRIVILRPGIDSFFNNEEALTSPSGSIDERGGVESFLEEVRERLKLEMQGKSLKRSCVVRGSGIETPFREKPSGPKQIARNFAKHIRENVRRDSGRKLQRSESMRSYRSEIQLNAPDSPNYLSSVGVNNVLSPRNLTRSLSVPISGNSFGKLLLEDRNVLSGAQISRKHECIDNESLGVIKRKKERFSFKEKVSNIRFSFPLRKMLFQKKIQSMVVESQHDFITEPASINFNEQHENYTEVPPSPVSICSSTHEECWREEIDHLSPISTPDTTAEEENDYSQVFKEISSNLTALRKQMQELESDIAEERTFDEEPTEYNKAVIEDHAESYIRDLLVASGLYNGTSKLPISIKIFEQVEESYAKSSENDHRLLLDLLNEALSRVLEPPMSRFRRKLVSSSPIPFLCKEKLLESVWNIVSVYLYPPNDVFSSYDSLEDMVAQDFDSTPWFGVALIDDESNGLGVDLAHYILEDIVDETVKDHYISAGTV